METQNILCLSTYLQKQLLPPLFLSGKCSMQIETGIHIETGPEQQRSVQLASAGSVIRVILG